MNSYILFLIFCNYQYLATIFKTKFKDAALAIACLISIMFNTVAMIFSDISNEWIMINTFILALMMIYNKNITCRIISIALIAFSLVLIR
ncbi:hypothetical protein VmeM32_00246 [Vibrio phage vB_VmeM-32]|nr:hypothetical protein VmeM32_00246 [Vibrio phage vB_VmeM-32]